MKPRPRTGSLGAPASRTTTALALIGLVGVTAAFAAFALWSFSQIRDVRGGGDSQISALKPVDIVGREQTLFDWSKDACEPRDIPDMPARAFRDASGQVQLLASHYVTRRAVGPSLGKVEHQCAVALRSGFDAAPARFDDRLWIASPYTLDGRNVFALVHQEYQGDKHPGRCLTGLYRLCWYNAITAAYSTDEGRTYSTPPGRRRLIASVPYRYKRDDGPFGLFQPSNIVQKDGYFYTLVHAERYRKQRFGSCLLRTPDLYQASAWSAWDGEAFSVDFENPYGTGLRSAADHVCTPVSPDRIAGMSQSLTYNTYLGKYMLVGPAGSFDRGKGRDVWGFYYSLSNDLIHWEPRKLIREAEMPWTYRCGDRSPVGSPSILDPSSSSRNFETAGRSPYLYFTRFHYKNCVQTLDRDLVRVRVRFSK